MTSDKLVEAFVTTNSTPQMQLDAFLRHINDTDKFTVDLVTTVFDLPVKNRTYKEMQEELSRLFVSKLSIFQLMAAVVTGFFDNNGITDGIKKSVIIKACSKMGYKNPLTPLAEQ
jgi:hypothetical protein